MCWHNVVVVVVLPKIKWCRNKGHSHILFLFRSFTQYWYYLNLLFYFYLNFCHVVLPKTMPTRFCYGYMHISLVCRLLCLLACGFSFVCYRIRLHLICYDNLIPDDVTFFSSHSGTNDDLVTFLWELLHTAIWHWDVYFSCCNSSTTTVYFTFINITAYVLFRMDNN